MMTLDANDTIAKNEINGISYIDVTMDPGFWNKRQKINSTVSIYAVMERFKETGRFDAFKFDWEEGKPNQPHHFWDSDVAKWIESAAYKLAKEKDEALESQVDELIELIEKNQESSGYFNIYFTVVEPESRFQFRQLHELYCAGHLIEAAVAYYEATGKDKFLNLMRKYADHIEKVFKTDHSASFATCRHEEIELALVRLYRATGEKRYLELSRFFIDSRGREVADDIYTPVNARFAQDHLPVREQSTAEGHAVRAVYLYCAMADLAREYGDNELFSACKKIFEDIVTHKMYITGGIGSAHEGEAFTLDYDLPNFSAYAESCAAIGLSFFAQRMLLLDVDSVYADIAEKTFYNGILSGVSLDGRAFFYTNPLEINPELLSRNVCLKNKRILPFTYTERQKVLECSCCPPNITRFMGSLGNFLYTYNFNTLYVHHYIASAANTQVNGALMEIIQKTDYPLSGEIEIILKGNGADYIALRIPEWCDNYGIKLNGNVADVDVKKGYAYIKLASNGTNFVELSYNMQVRLMEASPYVGENAGRVALQRGPIVYCLEAVDNGRPLKDIRIDLKNSYKFIADEDLGLPAIITTGYHRAVNDRVPLLYKPVSAELQQINLKFIPYLAFANRGESEMIVWVLENRASLE